MKHVLVTGADGFIGSHLVELLLAKGYKVRALVQYNSFASHGWIHGKQSPRLEIVMGDIRDPYFCDQLCRDIEIVFHLAALIAIPYSYQAPQSYIDTNVSGTMNMCQAALNAKVERFIQTSTSEVYGTALYVPIDENHPLQAQSPYSASKISSDAIAMSFYSSFGLPVTIARPFNTYGPRQSARAVIPTIICQIASGITEIKLGDTTPTRDFNYVEDTCLGFVALAQCSEAIGETVNIASNYEISVGDTLDLIKSLMKSDVKFKTDEERLRPSSSEVFRLWGDNKKLIELTGFKPETSIEQGLLKTINWFIEPSNLAGYDPVNYIR